MSETINEDSRAARFEALHVHLPVDYETYRQEMIDQWVEDVEDAEETGDTVRPMWLRRNAANTSEFSGHIDYLMPMRDEAAVFAGIDISSDGGHTEIQVLFPKEDGSGEPVVATTEPYDLDALARAIELVESTVQPTGV